MKDKTVAGSGMKAQAAHRALKKAILDQALQPGSKLPEDAIAQRLGVSRTLVREALVRLSEEGLVEMVPNKGALVARPTIEEARNIHVTRVALERLVVELLTKHLTPDQEKTLHEHLEAEEAARGHRETASTRLSFEFHTLLASMTKNDPLQRYVNELVARSSLILSLYGRPHSAECGVSDHREILEAIKSRNTEKAVALMTRHLEAISSRALLSTNEDDALGDVLKSYAVAEGLKP